MQSPDKVASDYLEENIPAGLVGAGRVRYKLNFMNAFYDALGDYEATNSNKDWETVSDAINTAKEAIAIQSNKSLLGVKGTPNRIIGVEKDEAVSSKPTAEPDRSVSPVFTIMEDANGNRARVYNDGTVEEIE